MDDHVALVERSLAAETRPEFADRVERQAQDLRETLASGDIDCADFAIGLEVETYAVTDEGQLAALPASVFGDHAAKELGVHNAELNTAPSRLDADGLAEQRDRLQAAVEGASAAVAATDRDMVLDAMWTVPPAAGSESYLGAVECREGYVFAENMRPSPRYYAIDNHVMDWADGEITLDAPGVETSFPTILFESLTASIQPHLQVPSVAAYPDYYNAAIRTMGPVLALATNSPFLPADLYDTDDPEAVVDATPHESRISVFEGAINVDDGPAKVRVPRDIETAAATADRLVADRTAAPFLREWLHDDERETFHDRFWELDHKRGTFWRWVRSVVGGDPVEGAGDGRTIRIEYRPLPTQPSVPDTVGLLALVAGLLRGIDVTDHPLVDLDHDRAEDCFYAVVDDGLDAELAWVTADGEPTSEGAVIYRELFALAREGLAAAGVSATQQDDLLGPIERRADTGVTPSRWKKARVRDELEAGADLRTAIERMQRAYIERADPQEPFVAWAPE
jgi:hypothetical protein